MKICDECGLPINICVAVTHCRLAIEAVEADQMNLAQKYVAGVLIALGTYCEEADHAFDLASARHSAAVH